MLSWVSWRFFKEIRKKKVAENSDIEGADDGEAETVKSLWGALLTITIADVSMSIDNVFAVAAIARENTSLLVFGLVLAFATRAM